MSVYQDPYLAESVGYNNGHALGIQQGLEAGYTRGWNAATAQSNPVVAECHRQIAQLQDSNMRLQNEIAQFRQRLQLQEEQTNSFRKENAEKHMAFLGLVAIAMPAMKAVALLPFEERSKFVGEYCESAVLVQDQEYVRENRYPHNQPLIAKHIPFGQTVISETLKQSKARREAAGSA